MKKYFITGIGTDVGKTFVSAIFTEVLKADYWKPVQAGSLDNTDTGVIKSLISNSVSKFYPETYKFKMSASPHKAAKAEEIDIDPAKFILPETSNSLIIEGAGGLMVPLSENFLIIDLIKNLDAEVILVSMNYLGSINHTLLASEALKSRNICVKGIVFNGERDEDGEKFILNYTMLKRLLHVNKEERLTKDVVKKYSDILNSSNYF